MTMWKHCVTILDEPDKVGPIELTDALVGVVVFLVTGFFAGLLCGLVLGGGLAAGLYRLKRGRPAGALSHWLHAQEFIRVPGFLSPRYVLYGPC